MRAPHGTEWGYVSGCRCQPCVRAGSPLGEADTTGIGDRPPVSAPSASPSAGVAEQGVSGAASTRRELDGTQRPARHGSQTRAARTGRAESQARAGSREPGEVWPHPPRDSRASALDFQLALPVAA